MKIIPLHIHTEAPIKPPEGMPCNGCGVCCLAEPCPLGALLTLRTSGPCQWLRWDALQGMYRCGVLSAAQRWQDAPGGWRAWLGRWAHRWTRRWIAASTACDCSIDDTPQ